MSYVLTNSLRDMKVLQRILDKRQLCKRENNLYPILGVIVKAKVDLFDDLIVLPIIFLFFPA